MNKATLAILASLSASIALADDFKTSDGKEYKNATVNHVEPDGIVITHSFGILKIPFTELPMDVQKRFGYDAEKIEAERATATAAARAAEEKQAEERRAAERERRVAERERAEGEKKAAADLTKYQDQFEAAEKRASESYKITPKGTLSGQVFVATKGGENFKLGAVKVSLFARDAIDVIVTGLKVFADAKIVQLQVQLDAAVAAEERAKAAVEQADAVEERAKPAVEEARAAVEQAKGAVDQAKVKEKQNWVYYHQVPSNNDARHAAEGATAARKAAEEGLKAAQEGVSIAREGVSIAREGVNPAQRGVDAAREQYARLLEEKASYYSAFFYFSHLGSPIVTAETDGDGKFAMEIPTTGAFVIAAQGERSVLGDKPEQYHWLQPVSLEGRQQGTQNLSNTNLTRTTGTPSLVVTED